MRFRLLGPTAVLREDGSPVVIPAPKRRAVLAALLLNANREVSSDELIRTLWGDEPPPAAVPSLQAHVSRLRRELGSGVIETGSHGYRICVESSDLDVAEFERLAVAGRQALNEGQFTTASTLLREALELWRGPALADIPGDVARLSMADSLDEARVSALELRVEADLRAGRHAQLVPELRQLTADYPLHERFWQQLMLALYRTGRQAEALAAYRELWNLLVEELGIEPSPELQELEALILRQDPSLAPTVPLEAAVRLPRPTGQLVGREREIDQLQDAVRANRLSSLVGPGGVGKTRLAVEVGHRLVGDFEAVAFVDLSGVRDPLLVLSAVGQVVGGGERPWEVIANRQALLILDNFEQVLDAAPDVARLLDASGRVHVLVTSRAPLRVRDETVVDLPPLALADATELFTVRARQALMHWNADAVELEGIVARLDGLPLAVELTAARVGTLAPRALRDALDRPLELMSRGPRDAPKRHQTLREAIAWSYELLSDRARTGFRGLSVFAGGFTFEAAGIVAGVDVESLSDLIDHSLVRRDGDRYGMLETIREFAFDEAQAHAEADLRRDQHLDHYLALLRRVKSHGAADDATARWTGTLSPERDNLRAAFDWALTHGSDEAVKGLAFGAGLFWLIVGSMAEGERWAQAAADRCPPSDPHARAGAIALLGEYPRWSGNHERAIEVRAEGIALARQTEDIDLLATLIDDAAWSVGALGRSDEANAMLQEAMALRRQQPDNHLGLSHTLAILGWQRVRDGRPDEALRLTADVRRALARAEVTMTDENETDDLEATALLASGQLSAARSMYERVLRDSAQMDFRITMLDSVVGLATIAAPDDPQRAAELLGMASRVRAESGIEVFDPKDYAELQAHVRSTLGDEAYEAARSIGLAVSIPSIPAVALEIAG